jgi:hypothetical protein
MQGILNASLISKEIALAKRLRRPHHSSTMNPQAKRLLLIGILSLGLYLVVVPFFWPPPAAQVTIPKESAFNQDLHIDATVSAWHSNFVVVGVRFYVDFQKTTAHGPKGSLDTLSLYEGEGPPDWTFWNLNRLTWPCSEHLNLKVPLSELAAAGLVQPGVVVGKVDVSIAYRPGFNRTAKYSMTVRSIPIDLSFPFEIQLK